MRLTNIEKQKRKSFFFSIGLTLSIVGVSIGGIIKLIIQRNTSTISLLILFLSMILMVDIKQLTELKYRMPTRLIGLIFLYSFWTLFLNLVSGYNLVGSVYGLSNQFVYFVQIILLWNIGKDFDTHIFLKTFLYIMAVTVIISAFFIIQNVGITGRSSFNILLETVDDATGVSRTTMGAIGFFSFIIGLVYTSQNRIEKYCKIICSVVGLFVVVLAARRSVYLAILLSIVLLITNKKGALISKKVFFRLIIGSIIITLTLFLLYKNNPSFNEAINHTIDVLINGLRTYIGFDNSDLAVSYRRARMESIPREFFNNSSLLQFLLGRGYMNEWLDIPYMQAFWDLGLFGGTVFFMIMGVGQSVYLLKRKNSEVVLFAKCYVALRFIECFANGAPYGRFLPIVLLVCLCENERRGFSYANKKDFIY